MSSKAQFERKYVGKFVPSTPSVLIWAMVGVAIANEAVSSCQNEATSEFYRLTMERHLDTGLR
jgi:hypothetical protein